MGHTMERPNEMNPDFKAYRRANRMGQPEEQKVWILSSTRVFDAYIENTKTIEALPAAGRDRGRKTREY